MMDEEYEWLLSVALFHPSDGFVGDDVGAVALCLLCCAVHLNEIGIVIFTLSAEDFEIVKSCGGADKVPFAYECGLVSGFLH